MSRHSDGGTHTSSAFFTHYDDLDTCGCCGAREGDGPTDCRDDVCREQARRLDDTKEEQ